MINRLTFKNGLMALLVSTAVGAIPARAVQKQAATKLPAPAHQQTLESLATAWLNRPALKNSLIGLEVMELPSGKVLFACNANRGFTPASTAKVFSTACAFDLLGPNFVYKTQLMAAGDVASSTVHGDVFIVPSQDPTFLQSDLRSLLSTLHDQGIHKIDGALRILPSQGGYARFYPGWLSEDWGQEWMPPASSLVVDRNIAQGGQALLGSHLVDVPLSAVPNAMDRSLLSSDLACGWVSYDAPTHEMRMYRSPGVTEKSPLVVANPDEYNLLLAHSLLKEMGIKTSAPHQLLSGTVIAEHTSRPLSKIIEVTLHESDNLYAQQILRTIGLPAPAKNGQPVPVSDSPLEERGLGRMRQWLLSIGVPAEEAVLFDGCGLSRKDGVSPHALNTVLRHMAGPKLDGGYLGLLKTGGFGRNGGTYHFKTGTMDSVSSVAGVLTTVGKQTLAVSVMINGHKPSIHTLRGNINDFVALMDSISTLNVVPVGAKAQQFVPSEPEKNPGETVAVTTTKIVGGGPPSRTRRHARRSRASHP